MSFPVFSTLSFSKIVAIRENIRVRSSIWAFLWVNLSLQDDLSGPETLFLLITQGLVQFFRSRVSVQTFAGSQLPPFFGSQSRRHLTWDQCQCFLSRNYSETQDRLKVHCQDDWPQISLPQLHIIKQKFKSLRNITPFLLGDYTRLYLKLNLSKRLSGSICVLICVLYWV